MIFQARTVSHCGSSTAHHPLLGARLGTAPVDTTGIDEEITELDGGQTFQAN